jgi:hypothetical protein
MSEQSDLWFYRPNILQVSQTKFLAMKSFSPSSNVIGFLEVLNSDLGAFHKIAKTTVNFDMSVRPSTCNNSASTGRIFNKFNVWIFSKLCREKSNLIKI